MRVAILAVYPLHEIPGLSHLAARGSHATWLPQLGASLAEDPELDVHWVVVSKAPVPEEPIRWMGQTFHCLHSPARFRIYRAYRPDCRLIRGRVREIDPDLVHSWGTEDCYGLAGAGCGRRWL